MVCARSTTLKTSVDGGQYVRTQLPALVGSSWQTGSSHNPIVVSINDPTDPWLDNISNCWALEEHHYAEIFAVSALFKVDDPPFWSAFLSTFARAAALRENLGHCLNCHEDTTLSEIVGTH